MKEQLRVDIMGAMARGYCSDKNAHKQLDADLIEAMFSEVLPVFEKAIEEKDTLLESAVEVMKQARDLIESLDLEPVDVVELDIDGWLKELEEKEYGLDKEQS